MHWTSVQFNILGKKNIRHVVWGQFINELEWILVITRPTFFNISIHIIWNTLCLIILLQFWWRNTYKSTLLRYNSRLKIEWPKYQVCFYLSEQPCRIFANIIRQGNYGKVEDIPIHCGQILHHPRRFHYCDEISNNFIYLFHHHRYKHFNVDCVPAAWCRSNIALDERC